MSTRNTTVSRSVVETTLPIRLSAAQVRSNRFTTFTESQRKALVECGAAGRLAKIYGVKESALFTSSGRLVYKGAEASRELLDRVKSMSARRFAANADALELLRVGVGWTPKRLALARRQGKGPERKGWAAVHSFRKAQS